MKLRSILVAAREHKASDAHILVGFPPMFRIAGDIVATRGGERLHRAEHEGRRKKQTT